MNSVVEPSKIMMLMLKSWTWDENAAILLKEVAQIKKHAEQVRAANLGYSDSNGSLDFEFSYRPSGSDEIDKNWIDL